MRKFSLLLIFAFPRIVTAQCASTTYRQVSNGGLCSKSITLFSDSTFNIESGCEASSHISFGKWKQKRNLLSFSPVDRKVFSFIDTVKTFGGLSNHISVTIIDNSGLNVSNRFNIAQVSADNKYYSIGYDSVRKCRADIRIPKSTLRIVSLERLFKKSFILDSNKSDSLVVHLTFSLKNISNMRADWSNEQTFVLEKKMDKLISMKADFVDDFSKPPQKSEYLLVR